MLYNFNYTVLFVNFFLNKARRKKIKDFSKTKKMHSHLYIVNKILYYYMVEVTNRFKALDMIDRVH